MPLSDAVRHWLRQQPLWLRFREVLRDGPVRTWQHRRRNHLILATPPVETEKTGPVEVRVLVWRRDWINLVWTLKSFYHYSGVRWPLYIHDGGLDPGQAEQLLQHFPQAQVVTPASADAQVEAELDRRNLPHCKAGRAQHVMMRKFVDFFLLTRASHVVSIDADILFFRQPTELIAATQQTEANYFNRDIDRNPHSETNPENEHGAPVWYILPLDELEREFGVRPPPRVNAGLSIVRPSTIDFDFVERTLAYPKFCVNDWLGEQTLHALCSTRAGLRFLSPDYQLDVQRTDLSTAVCKHYPGSGRPLLYEEGMAYLLQQGFLKTLQQRGRAC